MSSFPSSRKYTYFLLCCILSLFISSCNDQEKTPISIGFMGTLSGHSTSVGHAARDAVILAIEQLNAKGGIDGHKVELVAKDIQQNPETAKKVVEEFISLGIPVVIGPMFSSMSVAASEAANRGDILLISPTSSTTLLNDKDDNFFRLYPSSNIAAEKLADHVRDKSVKSISIIWDEENRAFTEDWKNYFVNRYVSQGGIIVQTSSYKHKKSNYTDLAKSALQKEPTAILILSNAYETAMLCQQIRRLGSTIQIFASEWSMTEDIIEMGAHSVEGIEFFHVLNTSSADKAYLDFVDAHENRFKEPPSYPAILAYEAAQVAIKGLQLGARTGSQLKQVLMQQDSIDVLQTSIRFDKYGEVQRKLYLNTVKDHQIVSVQ